MVRWVEWFGWLDRVEDGIVEAYLSAPELLRCQTQPLQSRPWRPIIGALAIGMVTVALWNGSQTPEREREERVSMSFVQMAHEGRRALTMADGSTLLLSDDGNATVSSVTPRQVSVRLEHGVLECDVARVEGRRFVVEAADFDVVVTGTRFTVVANAQGEHRALTAVRVDRGSVEIWKRPDLLVARLGAGEDWVNPPPQRASSPIQLDVADAGARHQPESPQRATPNQAQRLFEAAAAARRAGRVPVAAAALQELCERFPEDRHAGAAAFQLGGLRLDFLGDPQGAAEAFALAIEHGEGVRIEDAQARFAEALARAGLQCQAARDRYLRSKPVRALASVLAEHCKLSSHAGDRPM